MGTGCIVLLLLCFGLYTRYNDFPVHYHPDEPSKADQILHRQRNYNHPQLLLEVTQLATAWLATPMNPQATIEVARAVSAAFAAMAVVALALTGYRIAGLSGFVLAGLTVAFCPALLVNAHYTKEETALVLGLCLTLFATRLFWDAGTSLRRILSLILLGSACGVAASGKYTGLYAIAAVLPLALFAPPLRWYTPSLRAIALAASFLVVLVAINHRVFDDFEAFRRSFHRESRHAITDHAGMTMPQPNAFHASALARQCMPHVLLPGLAYLPLAVMARRRRAMWDVFAVLFAAGYFILLCWCVISIERYVLPIVVLLHFFAAMAILHIGQFAGQLSRRSDRHKSGGIFPAPQILVPAAFAALVATSQIPRCLDFLRQFNEDSRMQVRKWAKQHLPPGAGVVQDPSAALHGPPHPRWGTPRDRLNVRLGTTWMSASEVGELSSLRKRGFSHVVTSDFSYERFFNPHLHAIENTRFEHAWHRQWYEDLFRKHELIWRSPPARPMYGATNPEIRVYRLRE